MLNSLTRTARHGLAAATALVALAAAPGPARAQTSGTTQLRLRLESVVAFRIATSATSELGASGQPSPEGGQPRVLTWTRVALGPRGWLRAHVLRGGDSAATPLPATQGSVLRLCINDVPTQSSRDSGAATTNACTLTLGDDADRGPVWLVLEHY